MKTTAAALKITGLSVFALLLSSPATHADPIPIISGSLVATLESSARLSLEGSGGLSLQATGGFSAGRFGPHEQCGTAPYCGPGAPINLLASWSGSDLEGFVTIDGVTERLGMNTAEVWGGLVEFTGEVLAPSFDGMLSRSVSAPFLFTGMLMPPIVPGQGPPLLLAGRGTAMLDLRWTADDSLEGWRFERAVYNFEDPTPVPEPGSMALVGLGLTALVARRRLRRESSRL